MFIKYQNRLRICISYLHSNIFILKGYRTGIQSILAKKTIFITTKLNITSLSFLTEFLNNKITKQNPLPNPRRPPPLQINPKQNKTNKTRLKKVFKLLNILFSQDDCEECDVQTGSNSLVGGVWCVIFSPFSPFSLQYNELVAFSNPQLSIEDKNHLYYIVQSLITYIQHTVMI